MPKLIFVDHFGKKYEVDADVGQSVMQSAVDAAVPGILADCGGSCSCATCHGYFDDTWKDRLPPPSASETEMLECVIEPHPNGRLTCQVKVTDDMNSMVIHLPESQV